MSFSRMFRDSGRLSRTTIAVAAAFAGASLFSVPAQATTSFSAVCDTTLTGGGIMASPCTSTSDPAGVEDPALNAIAYTFAGTFSLDSNIQVFDIMVTGATAPVTIQSFAYGGTSSDFAGNPVTIPTVPGPDQGMPGPANALGGFATSLALFNSAGGYLSSSEGNTFAGCTTLGQTNAYTGSCYDAYLTMTLAPGTYYLALTEQNNSLTVPDSLFAGSAIQTSSFAGYSISSTSNCNTPFCDPTGLQMDGNYAIDFAGGVPEPGSFSLVSLALAVALVVCWRRRRVLGL